MITLAPRWDREAPSDPESSVHKFPDLGPLTSPLHPPHTRKWGGAGRRHPGRGPHLL